MQNYKKHEVEAKIKEAYSILSNAIKIAESQNGPMEDYYYSKDITEAKSQIKNYAEKQIFNNLKVVSYDVKNHFDNVKNPNGGSNIMGEYITSGKLANGMYLAIGYGFNARAIDFFFDINGSKGPNIIGHDVFSFTKYNTDIGFNFYGKPTGKLLGGATSYGGSPECAYSEPRCYYSAGGGSVLWNCNTTDGKFCTTAIVNNGFRIPDNYPVKKW